jgi:hypothetical protein
MKNKEKNEKKEEKKRIPSNEKKVRTGFGKDVCGEGGESAKYKWEPICLEHVARLEGGLVHRGQLGQRFNSLHILGSCLFHQLLVFWTIAIALKQTRGATANASTRTCTCTSTRGIACMLAITHDNL